MLDFVEKLKVYFENTSKEQVLKDWEDAQKNNSSQSTSVTTRDEKILYWAKQLEHKSLSVAQLVENVEWLIKQLVSKNQI